MLCLLDPALVRIHLLWSTDILTLRIGNFSRPGAGEFLKGFADVLGTSDSILIGLDATSDSAKV